MKNLYYELFSGVGFLNQLFSLETAIYMANRMKKKLHLIIKEPLVYCGKPDWNYGIIFDYLDSNVISYIENGLLIYKKDEYKQIENIINDNSKTYKLVLSDKLSNCVLIDKHLDISDNYKDIEEFCNGRKKSIIDWNLLEKYENIYFNQSNASRCFYNFYTDKNEYIKMNYICSNLKFHKLIQNFVDSKIHSLKTNNNFNSYIGLHLRFGDYNKDDNFIKRWNNIILNNFIPFITTHQTNICNLKIIITCDRKDNNDFFNRLYDKIQKSQIIFIEDLFHEDLFKNYFFTKKKIINNLKIKNFEIFYSLIYNLFNSKLDNFIGSVTSTYSVYTQYLRYLNNLSHSFYCNLTKKNIYQCKLLNSYDYNINKICKSNYEWVNKKYDLGHPTSWHIFWDIPYIKK